jgi:hypothetical protein
VVGGPGGAVASLPFATAAGGVALGSELGRGQNTFDQNLKNRRNLLKTYNTLLSQAGTQQEKDEIKKKIEELTPGALQTVAEIPLRLTGELNDLVFGNIARTVNSGSQFFNPDLDPNDPITPKRMKHQAEQIAKAQGAKTADQIDVEQIGAINALRTRAAGNAATPEGNEEEKERNRLAARANVGRAIEQGYSIDDETLAQAGFTGGVNSPEFKEYEDRMKEFFASRKADEEYLNAIIDMENNPAGYEEPTEEQKEEMKKFKRNFDTDRQLRYADEAYQ